MRAVSTPATWTVPVVGRRVVAAAARGHAADVGDPAADDGAVGQLDLHGGGSTIVLITHDRDLAGALPRRVALLDGAIVGDEREPAEAAA
jgi:hypothetical protein